MPNDDLVRQATGPVPLDEERLAKAIQSTILTSPDEYMGPGMGAYRQHWDALTARQQRHVILDARALAATYDDLAHEYAAPVERTLDEAWRDAEAALPEGHHLCDLMHDREGWTIGAYPHDHATDGHSYSTGPHPTPIAALDALTAALRSKGEGT